MAKTTWNSEKEYYHALLDRSLTPEKFVTSSAKKDLKDNLAKESKEIIQESKEKNGEKKQARIISV